MDNEITTGVTDQNAPSQEPVVPVKRGRGRPKGSKKKVQERVVNPTEAHTNTPKTPEKEVVGVYKIAPKAKKSLKEIDPNLVLTTTCYGTPIGIYGISKCGPDNFLNIIIRPRDGRDSRAIMISTDVVRPEISDVEIAKEFADVKFYDQPPASIEAIERVVGEGVAVVENTVKEETVVEDK